MTLTRKSSIPFSRKPDVLQTDVIAPLNAVGDKFGTPFKDGVVTMPPGWKEAYTAWAAAGWNGLAAPAKWGGQDLPQALNAACIEICHAASSAFTIGPVLTMAAIDVLYAYGADELKQRYLGKLVSGEWMGTMELTEPQAGSDVGALRTKAERANVVGMKIAVRGIATGENSFADCVASLKQAGTKTGREVAPLIAGDANLLGALEAGAAGTINACESIRVEDNTQLYEAYRAGDATKAMSLAERLQRLADVIYGLRIGRSFTYFHYRFKIATWMLGRIPNPAMRLPQVPPPADEVAMIAEALAASGKSLVHGAGEFADATRVAVGAV